MTSVLFIRNGDFSIRAREVLREVGGQPHLLLRLDVLGPYFPERDSAPFVRIVTGRRRADALITEVAADHSHLRSYFAVDQPIAGRIEFGYASEVVGSVMVRELAVERLDAERIDTSYHRVIIDDPGAFQSQLRHG